MFRQSFNGPAGVFGNPLYPGEAASDFVFPRHPWRGVAEKNSRRRRHGAPEEAPGFRAGDEEVIADFEGRGVVDERGSVLPEK